MDVRKTLIIALVIIFILAIAVFISYLVDSRIIVTQADVENTISATELTDLPSPDQSTISKFFSKLFEPFVGK